MPELVVGYFVPLWLKFVFQKCLNFFQRGIHNDEDDPPPGEEKGPPVEEGLFYV